MCDLVEFLPRIQMCFHSWSSYDQVTLPFHPEKVISLQYTEFPPEVAITLYTLSCWSFMLKHLASRLVSVLESGFPWDQQELILNLVTSERQ